MNRGLRYYLLVILAGLLVFKLADWVLAKGFNALSLRSQMRFSRMYAGDAEADVVIIGNSRGVNGFYAPGIEKKLGAKAFNLSYNGMSMVIAKDILLDYLDRHDPPKLVVAEVSNVNVKNDLYKNLKLYVGESDRLQTALKEEQTEIYYAQSLCHLYRFNSEYFLRVLYHMNKSDQAWINRYKVKDSFLKSYKADKAKIYENKHEAGLKALQEIMTVCKEKNIQLKLVLAPYLPAYMTDENRAIFSGFLQGITQETGMGVYDFSSALQDPKYFADPVHSNVEGAEQLLDKMVQVGIFEGLK